MALEITDGNITEILESNKITLVDKNKMIEFARHCMLQLVSTKSINSDMSEISSYDLYRISEVLNKYK
jgi:hypothetical protein